jgi:hypothetical protein
VNPLVLRSLRLWSPIAVAVTVLCGLVFTLAQQELRDGANDPQVQIAEDTAAALASGSAAERLMPTTQVNVASSIATFVIIFDTRNRVVASSATLAGRTPALPLGVLSAARASGEDRVTWEPRAGVRIAAVVVPVAGGGSVLAGRSLREVEQRESDLLGLTAFALLFGLGACAVTILAIEALAQRRRHVDLGGE